MNAPAGVTQEEGHAGFVHLPSAVPALIFVAILGLPEWAAPVT